MAKSDNLFRWFDSSPEVMLVHGARAVLRWTRHHPERRSPWIEGLLSRRPTNVVLVAMANKMARIVWAMLSRLQVYQPGLATA